MKHCKTCKHWSRYIDRYPKSSAAEDKKAGGFCESGKITYDDVQGFKPDILIYYSEGAVFWVGAEFGCVNHETL